MVKRNYKGIIIGLIIFLNFAGIEYELANITSTKIFVGNFWNIMGGYFFPVISTSAIYIIIFKLNKKVGIKNEILAAIFLCSIFSTGFIAAYLNDGSDYITKLVTTSDIQFGWVSAFFYSFIEENIKLILSILFSILLNIKDTREGFFIGLLIGLGFQFCEDISYIFEAGSEREIFSEAVTRLSGAISSHWMLTGIYVYGYMGLKNLKHKKYILYMFMPICLHMLWDSPLNDYYIVTVLISTITMLIFLKILDKEKIIEIKY